MKIWRYKKDDKLYLIYEVKGMYTGKRYEAVSYPFSSEKKFVIRRLEDFLLVGER